MSSFASYDGTEIGYQVRGDGLPLVCLPGGPGRAAEYLGDLGGLSSHDSWSCWTLAAWAARPIRQIPRRSALTGWSAMSSRSAPISAWTGWTCLRIRPVRSCRLCTRLRTRGASPDSSWSPPASPRSASTATGRVPHRVRPSGGRALVSGRARRAGEDLRRGSVDRRFPRVAAVVLRPLGRRGPSPRDGRRRGSAHGRAAAATSPMLNLDPSAIQSALTKLTAPVLLLVGAADPW